MNKRTAAVVAALLAILVVAGLRIASGSGTDRTNPEPASQVMTALERTDMLSPNVAYASLEQHVCRENRPQRAAVILAHQYMPGDSFDNRQEAQRIVELMIAHGC
jgi:hypothetical protein